MISMAAIAILGIFLWLLTGGTVLQEKTTLYLYIPDATGLASGSAVEVNGVPVGKVRAVRLSGSNDPNRVIRLVLTIEREHLNDITADSSAQVDSDLVGDKYVQITRGTSAARLQPNAEVPFKAPQQLMKTVDLQQFRQRLQVVDAILSDIEQGRNPVGQFILGDEFYTDLQKRLNQLEAGIRDAANTTTKLGQLLYTDELYRDIRTPVVQLDATLARMERGEGGFGPWLRDDARYGQLRQQATSLRRSIADLRSGSIFQSDDAYVGWTRTITSLIRSVDDLNSGALLNSPGEYESVTGSARELRETLRDFRSDPQKFLRIKVF